jgi:hypothetical protein
MNKRIVGTLLLGAILCGAPAFAAQNVANTSQKGSLLIFPLINIDPENGADTLIEISNDQNKTVHLECEYINQAKDRVDFDFDLTKKATASWDVASADGENVSPSAFPTGSQYTPTPPYSPVNPYQGELVCFAVTADVQNQIAFNHLTGTAPVVFQNDSDAEQFKQAFKYNAWAFAARASGGAGAADGTIQGTPGELDLTGNGAGTYDACPQYNVASFMPNSSVNGHATLGPVTTLDNDLATVSCNQDLRQDFVLHLTKLQFTTWSANENSHTGSYQCVDSVSNIGLSSSDNSYLKNPANFDFSILRTANARFQVNAVSSTQCPGSESAALLGVVTASIGINNTSQEDAEIGNTTQGAGLAPGVVYWDPAGSVPQIRRK